MKYQTQVSVSDPIFSSKNLDNQKIFRNFATKNNTPNYILSLPK